MGKADEKPSDPLAERGPLPTPQSGTSRPRNLFCEQEPGTLLYLPSQWAHATLNLQESLGVGGFVQEPEGLGLHMQLLHAPRGIGSLQNAAPLAAQWLKGVARAFPDSE